MSYPRPKKFGFQLRVGETRPGVPGLILACLLRAQSRGTRPRASPPVTRPRSAAPPPASVSIELEHASSRVGEAGGQARLAVSCARRPRVLARSKPQHAIARRAAAHVPRPTCRALRRRAPRAARPAPRIRTAEQKTLGASRATEKSGRGAMARARKFHPLVQASSCRAAPTPADQSRSAGRGGHALAPARRMCGYESSHRSMPPTRPSSITAIAAEAEGKSCARRATKARGVRSARRSTWRESVPTSSQSDTTGWTSAARCAHNNLCASF